MSDPTNFRTERIEKLLHELAQPGGGEGTGRGVGYRVVA